MKRLLLGLLLPLGCTAAITPVVLRADISAQARPTAEQVDVAIHGQESGGAANARTSSRGAVGGHQISPGTFTQYREDSEMIRNPRDNATVGLRIITDLMRHYDNDPARVAVAYFSGPGNVSAPGAKRPWIVDANDGNITTSQYVAQVLRRLPRAAAIPPAVPIQLIPVPATVAKTPAGVPQAPPGQKPIK